MRTALPSVRTSGRLGNADHAVQSLEDQWQRGEPDLDGLWRASDRDSSVSVLAALVKADLRCQFARGKRPTVNEYIDRYPQLRAQNDRVLSLVYEEYCLREEQGERPDTEEFCARYAPWKDSLASQLRYHRVLSRVVGGSPPPARFPEPGEHFEHFEIVAELGRGGAGRVYLACDGSLGGREVALKVSADRGTEPSMLGRLHHPHIVPVLSVTSQADTQQRGLCMPYQPGLPLDELIRRVKPGECPKTARAIWDALAPSSAPPAAAAPEAKAKDATPSAAPCATVPTGPGWKGFPIGGTYVEGVAWVAAKLSEALAYAHAQKIWHRDVKPANVLLSFKDGPQLLDFNLAHDPSSPEQAEDALRGGTLPYMAPEQLEAFLDSERWTQVNEAADLYSLGLLIRELLTGVPPETPDPKLPLPRAIRGLLDRRIDFVPDLRAVNPAIPYALQSIVARCLAYSPGDRYRNAEPLAEDLGRCLDRRPLKDAPNVSTREVAANWTMHNSGILTVTGCVAAFVILGVLAPLLTKLADRFLNPFEKRAAFLSAVADLDAGRKPAALKRLTSLESQAKDSPVIQFYVAAASVGRDKPEEIVHRLTALWSKSRAEDRLEAWGREHPAFARHAASLGIGLTDLMSSSEKVAQTRRSEISSLATHLLQLSHRLDRRSSQVRAGLAALAQSRQDFGEAERMLADLILEIEQPSAPDDPKNLRAYLLMHARVLAAWAGRAIAQSDVDVSLTESRLVQALADINRVNRLPEPKDQGDYYKIHSQAMLCEINLSLGQLASQTNQRDRANRYFEDAKAAFASIPRARSDDPPYKLKSAYFRGLEDRVRKALPAAPNAGVAQKAR